MRSFTHLALAASAAAQVFDAPFQLHPGDIVDHPLPTVSKRNTYEPCAEVAELWLAQNEELSKPGAASARIRVPAQRAYDCLMTVPVDVEGDIQEINELMSYLEYQSTLAWLKSGVKDQVEPLDIMDHLDSIVQMLKADYYTSDYEVQLTIRRLLDGKLMISYSIAAMVRTFADHDLCSGWRLPFTIRSGYHERLPICPAGWRNCVHI